MISFSDAMSQIGQGERPSVLLGNGFSRAWRDEIFNYANLLSAASFGESDAKIRSLFDRLGTQDFEAVMRVLVSAEMVIDAYGLGEEFKESVKNDQLVLKKALIQAISNTHPDRPDVVTSEQFSCVRAFISKFQSIFTVNYDLLLYWARNMDDLPPQNYTTDDGFRCRGIWHGHETDQQVHFLHGGLHIYDSGTHIKKHIHTGPGESIISRVRENLDVGKFPLFVSEPSSEKKKWRIERNPYLNFCFEQLRNVNGSFFVLGHSVDENDKHIFDQLKASRVSQIFIGLHESPDSDRNVRARANACAFLESENVKVEFFDAQTASVWA